MSISPHEISVYLLIPNRYLEAAKLNQGYAKYEEALRCAERGLAIDEDCLGTDHPLYQNSLKAVNNLKKHR